jgi:hypothetical protein
VHNGKNHKQAMGAVMSHLGARILSVLREDRSYELRDNDGNRITWADAKIDLNELPGAGRNRTGKAAAQDHRTCFPKDIQKTEGDSSRQHIRGSQSSSICGRYYLPANSVIQASEEVNGILEITLDNY